MQTIDKIELGAGGPRVSKQGFGCMGLSEFYTSGEGRPDEAGGVALIHRALELGVNFLDTADMYGPHINEELVGRAIREYRSAGGGREDIVLATKFGIVRAADGSYAKISGRPEYIKSACEASLKRLGVDYIDLYYQHRVDPEVPIQETVGALAELVAAGKIRFIGLSEAAPDTLRKAVATHPIAALQTEYSLWSRDPEDELLGLCRELGVGFVAYSPLGRGFLSGRFRSLEDLAPDDWRRQSPRFQGENFAKNLALLDRIVALANERGCTPGQLALAWLMAQDGVVPIPGTTNPTRLAENVAACDIVFSAEELASIEAVAPRGAAAGERYHRAGMRLLNG